VFPALYKWTTYPLTALLEEVYAQAAPLFPKKKYKHVMMVEFCSVLERALNFMHTGNTAVIATTVMNPLWIGRAILKDGFPCLNPLIVHIINSKHVQINALHWPQDLSQNKPHSSSRRSQLLTYGESHFNVRYYFLRLVCLSPQSNPWIGGGSLRLRRLESRSPIGDHDWRQSHL
jgi:hypothetical protein